MDVAGVVTEVGEGVEHLAVGDPAMGIVVPFGPHGAYREDKVLPGNSVVRAPAGGGAGGAATPPPNGPPAPPALGLWGGAPRPGGGGAGGAGGPWGGGGRR